MDYDIDHYSVHCLLRSNEVPSQRGSWTTWYCMYEFIQACIPEVDRPTFSSIRLLIGWQLNSVIAQWFQTKANCIFIGNEALVQIDFLVWRMQFSDCLFTLFYYCYYYYFGTARFPLACVHMCARETNRYHNVFLI